MSARSQSRRLDLQRAIYILVLIHAVLAVLGLQGCGGGDCPADDLRCQQPATTQPPVCTANPEVCR
jgi:hypothetical protein